MKLNRYVENTPGLRTFPPLFPIYIAYREENSTRDSIRVVFREIPKDVPLKKAYDKITFGPLRFLAGVLGGLSLIIWGIMPTTYREEIWLCHSRSIIDFVTTYTRKQVLERLKYDYTQEWL